jgi:hypothetical protein
VNVIPPRIDGVQRPTANPAVIADCALDDRPLFVGQ